MRERGKTRLCRSGSGGEEEADMMVGRGKPGHLWTCSTCHMEKDKSHNLSFLNYPLNCPTTICCGKRSEMSTVIKICSGLGKNPCKLRICAANLLDPLDSWDLGSTERRSKHAIQN